MIRLLAKSTFLQNAAIYRRKTMTLKELLIQQLDNVSDPLIVEVLDFLQFLKAKQEQDNEDLEDARAALATVSAEGTLAWDALKEEVGQ
jgi:hypothetical protein